MTLPKSKYPDIIIIISFAFFAFLYNGLRLQNHHSFVLLSSDAANIAGFAAAKDHPEFFVGDEILEDQNNYRFYKTIIVPITRTFGRLTGNYASAFVFLLGPIIFIQLVGFYLFGYVLFNKRYWAFLFAIINLIPVEMTALGEIWGVYVDPLPRVFFQALLPYLLVAAFYFRSEYIVWPWLLAAAGALMYVHPVSAPVWGFAIWVGFWLFQPSCWPIKKRIAFMSFTGIVFILVALPFLSNYLSSHIHGAVANYQQIYGIMKYRFLKEGLDIPLAFRGFVWFLTSNLVLPLGILGVIYVIRYKLVDYTKIALICLWMFVLLIMSVFVPFIEQLIMRRYQLIPLEIDLFRNMRYLFFLLIIFCLWPLAEITNRVRAKKIKLATLAISALLVFLCGSWYMTRHLFSFGRAGYYVFSWEGKSQISDLADAMDAIKNATPLRARILAASKYVLPIRYYAMRPVVFAGKDGGVLAFANHTALIKWYEKAKEMEAVTKAGNDRSKIEGFVALAKKFDAQFLLLDYKVPPDLAVSLEEDIVYTNSSFTLLRINKKWSPRRN